MEGGNVWLGLGVFLKNKLMIIINDTIMGLRKNHLSDYWVCAH